MPEKRGARRKAYLVLWKGGVVGVDLFLTQMRSDAGDDGTDVHVLALALGVLAPSKEPYTQYRARREEWHSE